MNVNGIGTAGYPAWQGARKAQQNAAGRSFAEQVNNVAGAKPHTSIVYMKTDDMLYSGGNGTGLSFYIKYAEGSTEDDPTVIAKGVDENGNEFEQTIHQCHLVNIWTKSDVPLTGVHPSCWLQPAILLGLFYLKTLHLKIHFHGNYCFFQQKTQMDGVEPFLSGGLTILFDFFAEFYIST